MPKTLTNDGSRRPYLPWDKWLVVGKTWTLVKDRDFKCTTRTMVVYLYTKATSRGLRVKVKELGEGRLSVTVSKGDS